MNRKEIKEKAKEMIRGKLWDIWKALLISMIPMFIVNYTFESGIEDPNAAISIFNLLFVPLTIGVNAYILNFIREKSYNINSIWQYYKKFFPILATMVMYGLIVFGGLILFIIPGIILAFAYMMVPFLLADGEDNPIDVLKKSRIMMKGYKMDYFIFILSFIPWLLLIIVTLGIATIYVTPYITVSTAIYYDELKKKQTKEA